MKVGDFMGNYTFYDEAAQQQNRKNKENFYSVTPTSCTCMDFQKRGLPCKHIYKLQNVLNGDSADSVTDSASDVPFRVRPLKTDKSKTITLLLCIFLGYFGAHYFYAGRFGMGILYLCTIGLFGIGWVVDIVRICTNHFSDKYGRTIS